MRSIALDCCLAVALVQSAAVRRLQLPVITHSSSCVSRTTPPSGASNWRSAAVASALQSHSSSACRRRRRAAVQAITFAAVNQLQNAASTRQDASDAPRPRSSTGDGGGQGRDEAQALQEVQMLWKKGSRTALAVLCAARQRRLPRRRLGTLSKHMKNRLKHLRSTNI